MSNNDISYLQILCSLSDDYVEHLENLSNEELHAEHKEVFGEESQSRIVTIKSIFSSALSKKKKEIASQLVIESKVEQDSNDIVARIKTKYGSLKRFFHEGFLNNPMMPSDLTLQYRNITEVTDEDIELLIDALHEHGDLQIEDD